MEIFFHHIYEFQKGLRRLVLCTLNLEQSISAQKKLRELNINFMSWDLKNERVNVFFGAKECIEVLNSFSKKNLSELSTEEDFILRIMLGYDRLLQCERYLNRKKLNSTKKMTKEMSCPKLYERSVEDF